jgi:hypothetical protein
MTQQRDDKVPESGRGGSRVSPTRILEGTIVAIIVAGLVVLVGLVWGWALSPFSRLADVERRVTELEGKLSKFGLDENRLDIDKVVTRELRVEDEKRNLLARISADEGDFKGGAVRVYRVGQTGGFTAQMVATVNGGQVDVRDLAGEQNGRMRTKEGGGGEIILWVTRPGSIRFEYPQPGDITK